tara:strand:+ start:11095 stop:11514 length:420 start_codon:yes stop_codon:yes gene_type:complete
MLNDYIASQNLKIYMADKIQFQNIINKIFKISKKVRFVTIISDSGKIILSEMKSDKHSLLKKENEEKFCREVAQRKKMRKEFDKSLGKVRYVNVERENISQIVVYVKSKSIFVTVEPELTVDSKAVLVSKIKKITTSIN